MNAADLPEGSGVATADDRPLIPACHLCGDWHYNACPLLWGGQPEMASLERREGWNG